MRYSVLLPAYNEERTIQTALDAIEAVFASLNEPYEIIVIDDGSTDRTKEIVRACAATRPAVKLHALSENGGKGAAIEAGVRNSTGEVLLFLDCDLAVHPETVRSFLPYLAEADILIGSRRVPGARIVVSQPISRVWSGQAFNLLVRLLLGLPYADTQCGFKAFHRAAAEKVFTDLETRGWVFDVEILLRAKRLGLRVKELPVEWRNGPESRVRFADTGKILADLWKLR